MENKITKDMSLVTFLTTDLTAISRGRSILKRDLADQMSKGCGWVPANSSITPFNTISDDNPWGSLGDVRLLPDADSLVSIESEFFRNRSELSYVHCDIVSLKGEKWPTCPRTLLKEVEQRYRDELGIELVVAFEHEFTLEKDQLPSSPAFSLRSLRKIDDFSSKLLPLLDMAGVEPEMILAEFGDQQYEVTCAPTSAVKAADRAVNVRELTKELASDLDYNLSFSPKAEPGAIGNGVHVHISLKDLSGNPLMYDAERPNGLSEMAGSWCAGILDNMRALCAFTAPSVVSYLRLCPHNWSAAYSNLGDLNRETSLRICPTVQYSGTATNKQYNIEYRALDITASPHLALATILLAGLEGIKTSRDTPKITAKNPQDLSESECEQFNIRRLPSNLTEALGELKGNRLFMSQLPPKMLDTYLKLKQSEVQFCVGLDDNALCKLYKDIY